MFRFFTLGLVFCGFKICNWLGKNDLVLCQNLSIRDQYFASEPIYNIIWIIMNKVHRLQEHVPELHGHFQALGIATSMFASSWFLALYTTILPLPIACRVFDAFLSEVTVTFVCQYFSDSLNHCYDR